MMNKIEVKQCHTLDYRCHGCIDGTSLIYDLNLLYIYFNSDHLKSRLSTIDAMYNT